MEQSRSDDAKESNPEEERLHRQINHFS